ncbi:unnamed protein product [Oppiella nova]|uniref:Protein kinase domain-containing protein n=1 Tax=Oppiella nova TaxID=334625 RepID=A0A7R9M2V5_9ACAR|nr:unnamed protein product [Oppiella nova]CAG2169693.1 unnamed protein product [Oppiella nova]
MSRKVPSSNRAQKIINYTIGDNAGIHLTGGGYINDDPANTGGQYTSGVSNSANLSHMTMSNMSNMNFIQGSSIQLGGGGGRSGSGSGGGGTGGVTGNGGGSRGARQQMAMLSTPVNIQGPTDINYQANINKPKNGTIRAAKRIEIHGTSDRNNALDEFTKLTQLDPDYVVKCHDWWIENDHFYIFMDYHRDTLRDIIELKPGVYDRDQGQPMDVTEFYMSCQIFRQLLDGVNYLHGLRPKMIHRDLKPDNILVSYANDPARFVRLCDFGLAVNHDKTCNNQGSNFHTHDVGTVRYQAPEIARVRKMGKLTKMMMKMSIF